MEGDRWQGSVAVGDDGGSLAVADANGCVPDSVVDDVDFDGPDVVLNLQFVTLLIQVGCYVEHWYDLLLIDLAVWPTRVSAVALSGA